MIDAQDINSKTAGVRLRPVALPVEHGGWGLSLEPVVLGLLLAPSVAGLCLAAFTMGAFLARHPFKLAVGDYRRGRRFPRTALAERFALLYAGIAALSFLAAIKTSQQGFLLPLLLAAPLAAVQLIYDGMGRSRALAPELAGSIAMAAIASGIALAGGWPRPLAFGLWAILAARVVPTILYVRAKLKLLHGKHAPALPVMAAHILAVALMAALARSGIVPFLALIALLVLLLRAVLGLSKHSKPLTAKGVGLRELGFGAMTVAAAGLGHALGW